MALARKDDHPGVFGNRAFIASVLWILALLGAYFVLADWHALPALIASTLEALP